MKSTKNYQYLNNDLNDYQHNETHILYISSAIYLLSITFILAIQSIFTFDLLTKIIINSFVVLLLFIKLKSTINLRQSMINNRKLRLERLFEDKLDLDSIIYKNNVIKTFDKNEITKIVMINNLPHIEIDNHYNRIHAIMYDNEWIEDLMSANELSKNHYAKLISRELIDDIETEDFKEFINTNDCMILVFYENRKD